MSFYSTQGTFKSDKPILAFAEGYRAVASAQVGNQYISPDKEFKRVLIAGSFIARVGSTFRPLPRGTVTVASSTSSPRFKVKHPYYFVAGDSLSIVEPYATLTVASTALGYVSVNGKVFSFTPTGVATASEAAIALAAYFNSVSQLSSLLRFVPVAATILVFSKDGFTNYEITPGGSMGTTAVTTALNTTSVGTVLKIDTDTEEVVLTTNAGLVASIGVNIGVAVDEVLGFTTTTFDFTSFRQNYDFGLGTAGKLWKQNLVYWDDTINKEPSLFEIEAKTKW
jgi:hypothetical protein